MVLPNESIELDRIERDESLMAPAGIEGHLKSSNSIKMSGKVGPLEKVSYVGAKTRAANSHNGLPVESVKMTEIKKKVGIMVLVAFFAIIIGGTLGFLWPSMFMDILNKELVLKPNSTSYKMWQKTPVPMHLKVYLFNWTNYEEVMHSDSVKPNFVEMGPYVFREVDTKVNKKWNDNGTITFQQRREWFFLPELSNGTLTDKVTNLNPIAATVAYILRNAGSIKKTIIDKILGKVESVAITKTVNELLFTGYDDLLLKLAVEMKLTNLPFEQFAWFYARNGSDTFEGTYNMLTGSKNINDIGMLQEWQFSSKSQYKSCGKMEGTNGDLWPPLKNNKTVSVFSPDVCTTLSLTADGTTEWMGITGSKFISDESMLDNGTLYKENKCRCEGVECQPSGTLNISACQFGSPTFISLPHFYLADPIYRENITGMNPNKKDHEFSIAIEPSSGIPLQVQASLQINFLIQQENKLPYFKKLPGMYVPMLWFTQEVNLTSEYAKQVKLLILLPSLGTGVTFGIAGAGVLLIIIATFLYVRQKLEDEQNEHLVPKENENRNRDAEIVDTNEE